MIWAPVSQLLVPPCRVRAVPAAGDIGAFLTCFAQGSLLGRGTARVPTSTCRSTAVQELVLAQDLLELYCKAGTSKLPVAAMVGCCCQVSGCECPGLFLST